jgi:hypothetical protein
VAIHVKVAEGVRRELYLEYLSREGGSAHPPGDGSRMGSGFAGQTVCL